MLGLKPNPATEIDISTMEALWFKYEKTQEQIGQSFESEHPEINPLTRAEEVHAWEDWALAHYEPVFEAV